MSEAVTRVDLLPPGPLAGQGKAIAAQLQLAFPPSLFQFRVLPPKINKAAWGTLTQGNQPFLGLGFNRIIPNKQPTRIFSGRASWTLLLAVRRQGTPIDRYYGTANGVGVLLMATVATAVLHGFNACTGNLEVTNFMNVVADEWSDDSSIIALDLEIPLTLNLNEAISQPSGLGIFEELATTWNIPADTGSTDIFTSDWENPNVPT